MNYIDLQNKYAIQKKADEKKIEKDNSLNLNNQVFILMIFLETNKKK